MTSAERWTEIRCGNLLDTGRRRSISDQRILICNDRIVSVGEVAEPPSGTEIINLTEYTCMPGLMDMHVHLFIDATINLKAAIFQQSSAFYALMGLRNAQALLRCGITTIRVPGDLDGHFAGIDLRDAIARGDHIGPRMIVAPHMFSCTGGAGDFVRTASDLCCRHNFQVVDGVDEIRKAVRREIRHGADWIKVYATGDVLGESSDPATSSYSGEELSAFVEEAHRFGKRVMAHAHGDGGARAAIDAGVDCIEHGTMLEPDTIDLMAKKGVWYVPTRFVHEWILENGARGSVEASNLVKLQKVIHSHGAAISYAHQAGVKMAIGSDCVFPVGLATREYFALRQFIPDEWTLLQMGTRNSAELIGMSSLIGSIAPGKQADLIAMDESPLDDIRNIERVKFVMKAGQIVLPSRGNH